MNTLFIKCRDRDRYVEYNQPDEARQELMRFLDDGHISQYQYTQYIGFLLNGNHSVVIDGEVIFEAAALVEVDG